jgi:hypothetical protein
VSIGTTEEISKFMKDKETPLLLGRSGFFDKFIVTFDEKNKRVKLKRTNYGRV